ncbi:hypothetical protein HELRODRAFT_193399 [Helobdella robusta]|uniref:Major facilitator superfamily (MFS) profile domain-containing protein n=1 Tax=Helobdella robusta TaxID=6412 RepID=T1FUY4_HELRO|nr:hypothetical protein HELRODRAFT_193399 [Helobdella robusta]ESN96927.1 hypothetical protein HELRODRAFT_193399 [Helobdella robusta]
MSFKSEFNENRRGWLVFVSVIFITITRSCFFYSFGIIVNKLTEEFNESLTIATWVGMGQIAITHFISFLPAICIKRLGRNGYRICGIAGTLLEGLSLISSSYVQQVPVMFFTYTLLFGAGSCFVYMTCCLTLIEFFPKGHKRHVLATTCVNSGYAISSLIYNPLVTCIVEYSSWRTAFQIQAVIILFFGILGSWTFLPNSDEEQKLLPSFADDDYSEEHHRQLQQQPQLQQQQQPEQQQQQQPEQQQQPQLQQLQQRQPTQELLHQGQDQKQSCEWAPLMKSLVRCDVLCWLLGEFFNSVLYYTPFYMLPHYMTLKNLTASNISLVMTVLSLSECIFYLLTSLPGDYLAGKLIFVSICACSMATILNACWTSLDSSYEAILGLATGSSSLLFLNLCVCQNCKIEKNLQWNKNHDIENFIVILVIIVCQPRAAITSHKETPSSSIFCNFLGFCDVYVIYFEVFFDVVSPVDGLLLAMSYTYLYACSAEATGLHIDVAWSATNFCTGVGISMAPLFSGLIYDTTQSYNKVFLLLSLAAFMNCLLFSSIPLIQHCRNRKKNRGDVKTNINDDKMIGGIKKSQQTLNG